MTCEERPPYGMSSDGPTPPPCDREVFEKGELVFMTSTIGSNALEGWVQKVAARSGQRVDWHWAGGRACVLALGDLDRVQEAIAELKPEHDALYEAACGPLRAIFKKSHE